MAFINSERFFVPVRSKSRNVTFMFVCLQTESQTRKDKKKKKDVSTDFHGKWLQDNAHTHTHTGLYSRRSFVRRWRDAPDVCLCEFVWVCAARCFRAFKWKRSHLFWANVSMRMPNVLFYYFNAQLNNSHIIFKLQMWYFVETNLFHFPVTCLSFYNSKMHPEESFHRCSFLQGLYGVYILFVHLILVIISALPHLKWENRLCFPF